MAEVEFPSAPGRRLPSHRLHKPSGRAVVTLGGRDHFLGPWGSEESREAYRRVIGEWLATELPARLRKHGGLTVAELILAYWKHAKGYYRKHGVMTSEVGAIKVALKIVRQLYGGSKAAEFGPLALKTVRDAMVRLNWARTTVNAQIIRVRRMFKWAAASEMLPSSIYGDLRCVDGLRRGRTSARETERVAAIADAVIERTLPHLSAPVAAMVRLQRLTGMRPGEVVQMRACDIDMTAAEWIYRPASYKTEHHDQPRVVPLLEEAQTVLRPFLKPDTTAYLFSPREAVAAQRAEARRQRRSPMTPSQARRKPKKNPQRTAGDSYDTASYRRAIARACEKNGIPDWAPNQIRHRFATEVRRQQGLEAARVVLGHKTAVTSEFYAEVDHKQAIAVMKRVAQAG